MNLIIGSRSDGFGRLRIILTSAFLLVATVPWIVFGYLDSRDKPISEMAYVADCLAEANTWARAEQMGYPNEMDFCAYMFGVEQRGADQALRGGFLIAAIGALISAMLWVALGLVGWIYRGFAEKNGDA